MPAGIRMLDAMNRVLFPVLFPELVAAKGDDASAIGTIENPFTVDDGGDPSVRCFKFCCCSVCGEVERCTPSNDFYGTSAPLRCERCFARELSRRGMAGWLQPDGTVEPLKGES